jgi:prepilin-type N-terminal cleavage/methylation domain-containing protein
MAMSELGPEPMSSPSSVTAVPGAVRPGFSLIELLVVILIIAVVIAIVVPALGGARNIARKQETNNLITTLQQASVQFQLDNRRAPGYFTAAEMGSTDNADRGFSGMQNAMLDLAGGIVTGTPAGSVAVGPIATPARQVQVDPTLIGAKVGRNKNYFVPTAKFFKKQDGNEGGTRPNTSPQGHIDIPELVDSWGMPILYWQLDTAALGTVATVNDFARLDSGPANAPTVSRFYWNNNAAFLGHNQVGFKRTDQAAQSLLGEGAGADRAVSLAGILGSPGSPGPYTTATAIDAILPTGARGGFVIHAAGLDGIYTGRSERGGALAAGGPLHYGLNFRGAGNTPHTDASGKQISIDLATEFDDLIVGGN